MADSHKDIIITPNRNLSGQPQISFTGFGNDPITIKVLDDTTGALSFEGSAGQLFSITNNLTSGSIFSVNDVSGIPSIDVDADGTVALAPFDGNVAIGLSTPAKRLHVYSNEPEVIRVERSTNNNALIEYKNTDQTMYAGLSSSTNGWGVDLDNNVSISPLFIVSPSGNIGIGKTADSTNKLSIAGSGHNLTVNTTDREIVTPNYTINPGWNLSTASYSGKTPKPTTPETAPTDVFFKPDGTKMYVCGTTLDAVAEFNLTTPWDTTTAVHYQTFSTALQESAPRGVTFTNDGLTMFIVGDRGFVIKYSLSIAWDVSTATFESQGIQSYYVYDRERDSTGVFFNPDGTQMFITGVYVDSVVTYDLTEAWNINTAVFLRSTSFASFDSNPGDLYFKSDGSKLYLVGYTNDNVYEFEMSSPWNTSSPTLLNTYSTSGKSTAVPSGIDFSADGSYMYVTDSTTDTITQYTLSTPWSLANVSVTARLGSATDSVITGVFFKSDGLKMYTIGSTGDAIYEYELSTAWDITTAIYTDKLFVGYEDATPEGLFLKPDGTHVYFVGRSVDRVFEYTLQTPWSISTVAKSFYDLYRYTPFPRSISFTPDGKNMYSLSYTKNRVTQYTLSTAWDINTLSYVTYVNVGSNDITPEGLKFSPDGSKMYVIGSTSDSVFEYILSPEWDISTATYFTSYYIGAYETAPTDIAFKYDGSVMYVVGTTGDDITEFNLESSNLVIDGTLELNAGAEINGSLLVTEKITTYGNIETNKLTASRLELSDNLRANGVIVNSSWNIEDATIDLKRSTNYPNFYIGDKEASVQSLYMKPDGTRIFVLGSTSDDVHEYQLNPAYDITSAVFVRTKSVNENVGGSPVGLNFKSDGTKMYILTQDSTNCGVFTYSLNPAWDISTATYTPSYTVTPQTLDISGQETTASGMYFKQDDGKKLYVVGTSGDDVTQYNLTTGWDLTTATAVATKSVVSEAISATSVTFSDDGLQMFISCNASSNIYRYVLTTAWDITTASFNNGSRKEYTIAQSAANDEIFIGGNPDGKKLYVLGNTADTVYQYTLGTAWEIDTATYDSKSFAYGNYLTTATGISFKSDGTKLYLVGTTTDLIYEFDLTTAWDISTAQYTPGIKEVTVSTESPAPQSFYIRSNGTDLFVLSDNNASSTVKKYGLQTAWDISTASYVSGQSVNVGVPETDVRGLSFSSDGTKMYVVGNVADYVEQYNLSSAWDLTTASYSQNFYIGNSEASAQGVTFSTNGEYFFIVGSTGDNVYRYSMTTPWDISTAEFEYLFLLSGQDGGPVEVFFNEEGTKMYMAGSSNNRIYQYSLAIPWDITSSLYLESTPDLRYHTAAGGITGVFLNPTADKLYVSSGGNGKITQFTLDIEGFTSTLNLGKAFNIGYTTGSPYGLYFKSDGLTAFVPSTQYVYELTLSTAWSIATAEVTGTKDLGTSYDDLRSIFFSSDGTKSYTYEIDVYRIIQWNISTTPWSTSTTWTYQNNGMHLQKFSTGIIGIFLSSDGTKVYFIYGNKIIQHTLTTAWDLSTANMGDVLKIENRETAPQGITFGGDAAGTRLYVIGSSGDDITQFNLSTAWDITTAVYSTAATVESTTPVGLSFNSTGDKVYVADGANDRILQYNLTTAWAINTRSTATIVRYNLNTKGIITTLTDIVMRTTGTNANKDLFVIGSTTDSVKKITLPTANDLNSINDTNYYDLNSWTYNGWTLTDINFNDDGTKFYLGAYGTSNSRVYEYNLPTAWDLNSLGYVPPAVTSINIYGYDRNIQDFCFNSDGSKIYMTGNYLDRLCTYDLPTPYTLVGATNFDYMTATREDTTAIALTYGDGKLFFSGQSTDRIYEYDMNGTDSIYGIDRGTGCIHIQRYQYLPHGIFIRPDGLKMYINGGDDQLNQYTLSTPWDITTATYDGEHNVGLEDTGPAGVSFKYDGTKMYICGSTGDEINEYDLSIPWDITNGVNYVQTFSIASFEQSPTSMYFRKDGESVFISGSASGQVHHFSLSTPWDISTMSYVRSVYIGNQESVLYSVYFKSDGLKMYCLGGARDRVLEYRLSIPWDISTALLNKEKQVNIESAETNPWGLFFDTLGTKMYVTGYANGELYQFDLLPRSKTLSIDGTTYINGDELVSGDLTVNGDTTVRGKLSLYDKVYTGSFTADRALKVNIDGTDMYLLLQTI